MTLQKGVVLEYSRLGTQPGQDKKEEKKQACDKGYSHSREMTDPRNLSEVLGGICNDDKICKYHVKFRYQQLFINSIIYI